MRRVTRGSAGLAIGLALAGAALAGCNTPSPLSSATPSGGSPAAAQSPGQASAGRQPASSSNRARAGGPVTEQQAVSQAISAYHGQVRWSGPDSEDGQQTWKVKLTNVRQGNVDVEIGQDSGQVVTTDCDDPDHAGDPDHADRQDDGRDDS